MAVVLALCVFLLSSSSLLLLAPSTYDVAPPGPGGDVMAVGSMRFCPRCCQHRCSPWRAKSLGGDLPYLRALQRVGAQVRVRDHANNTASLARLSDAALSTHDGTRPSRSPFNKDFHYETNKAMRLYAQVLPSIGQADLARRITVCTPPASHPH